MQTRNIFQNWTRPQPPQLNYYTIFSAFYKCFFFIFFLSIFLNFWIFSKIKKNIYFLSLVYLLGYDATLSSACCTLALASILLLVTAYLSAMSWPARSRARELTAQFSQLWPAYYSYSARFEPSITRLTNLILLCTTYIYCIIIYILTKYITNLEYINKY